MHVVFGHVIDGVELVSEIENQVTDKNSKPLQDVLIADCGELIPPPEIKSKGEKLQFFTFQL